MTLCGWKIFSKNKQRIRCVKNDTSSPSPPLLSLPPSSSQLPSSSSSLLSLKQHQKQQLHQQEQQQQTVSIKNEDDDKMLKTPTTTITSESISHSPHNVPPSSICGSSSSCTYTSSPSKLKLICKQTIKMFNLQNDKNCDDDRNNIKKKKVKQKFVLKNKKDNIENKNKNDDDDNEENNDEEGNPRNKCALKPGHSLMDWIRLGSSGCDLTGTKGIIRPVSSSELQLHCKKDDAWLAIRGKVYNVTHYMDFHPGGPDELMKGVGKDATKMFDDIHGWVNYEQLLSKCYIGPYQNIVKVDLEPSLRRNLPKHQKTFSANGTTNNTDNNSSDSTIKMSSTTKLNTKNTNDLSSSTSSLASSDKVVPRFDWIQKSSEITLIFYTKSFCNPGLILTNRNNDDYEIKIMIGRSMYQFTFKLFENVKWPCIMKINNETGKIEINFEKCKIELWKNYGVMELKTFENNIEDLWFDYEVIENHQITHDSYAIYLKSNCKTIMMSPIGYHVSVTALVNGNYVTRSYTPVPAKYMPTTCPNQSTFILFLIKSYTTGILAKHITSLSVNNQISSISENSCSDNSNSNSNSSNVLKLSQPKGNLILKKLLNHYRIGLLAAGSGITPMLSVIDHLLLRSTSRIEGIHLLYFNKSEKDIWCRDKLESIATKDNRFIIRHILSDPDENWKGESGRITKDLILKLNEINSQLKITFYCICGPTPFNELCHKIFNEIEFQSNDLHFFQG